MLQVCNYCKSDGHRLCLHLQFSGVVASNLRSIIHNKLEPQPNMRVSTFLSTAICLFSVAEANVSDLTIPPVIKVGEDFVANFTYPSQQPRDVAIVWGVGPDVAKPGEFAGYNQVGVTKLWSDSMILITKRL
jgi:hypothetical protein